MPVSALHPRHLGSVALLGLTAALLFSTACTGSSGQVIEDQNPNVMYRPPKDATMPSVPSGPPVLGPDGKPLRRSAFVRKTHSQPGKTGKVAKADIEALMRRGPAYIFQVVSLRPARENGVFKGYRIESMSESAQHAVSPGLKTGDVITHVNGLAIRNPGDYHQAWSLMRDVKQIRIDFRRESKPTHVVWAVTP